MKKNEQIKVNTYVEIIADYINTLLRTSPHNKWLRMYNCKAELCCWSLGYIAQLFNHRSGLQCRDTRAV